MLHYSKDTLRYVKLFGALKSIWRAVVRQCLAARQEGGSGTAALLPCQPGPSSCPHNPVPSLCVTVAPVLAQGL